VLLQVIEDGRLTDSKGRTVDLRNCVVIMTSNVGANLIRKESRMGFKPESAVTAAAYDYEAMKERVTEELKRTFRPEFLNRVDEIIVFHSLDEEHIHRIVGLMLKSVAKRIAEYGLYLEFTDTAKDLLARKGYDQMYGARPLRRVIQRLVEDRLSEEMLQGRIKDGDVVTVDADGDSLTFSIKQSTAPAAAK